MVTDTSEKGLEALIVDALTGQQHDTTAGQLLRDAPSHYAPAGYVLGSPADYDRDYAVDVPKLLDFLSATQPHVVARFDLDADGPERRKFLARLQGEVARLGIVEVLRNGIKHGPAHVDLFYGTPSPNNLRAVELAAANVFSVTRQLRYSADDTQLALDLCLFINGLPVATFELKNSLTKQTVEDAVQQYQRDRNPRELLFQQGRCLAHFAVDDQEVRFCTHLNGKASWFLPFNQGWNDGAGNPPNPHGLKTDYLWRDVLTRESLTDIIENYAQLIEERDERTGRKARAQIFPRFHQRDVVHKLLAHTRLHGAGKRYLIQHSAGSGKSNSIAWLAHQLVGLERDSRSIFDSVIIVTDRRVLDKQIKGTVKQFAQVASTVGHAERSGDLRRFLTSGRQIIISTIQKFPVILEDIGNEHRDRTFAILIDEAHSSQSGRTAAKMNMALSANPNPQSPSFSLEEGAGGLNPSRPASRIPRPDNQSPPLPLGEGAGGWGSPRPAPRIPRPDHDDEDTFEDQINRIMESSRMLPNASYFAFTATPKNKTLEIFGEPYVEDGVTKRRAFHTYTMKQAIQEGFILDVLQHYTPVQSYYRLMKTVEDDPEFDVRRTQRKLKHYVESHDHAVRRKAEIMVDHFHEQVAGRQKIGGQARAMIVTGGIERAIQYFHAVRDYLRERKSPYEALVAFSGEHEYNGRNVTESTLNGFPGNDIAERFQEEPYRFLICADKFQTGYDEPLLHTMYVDKPLSGIKAVQTLSRLNRSHPRKHDTFVLDFMNDIDTIRAAFEPYYRATILSGETDPNKLHDLKSDLDRSGVYAWEQVEALVHLYLSGADRDRLDPILDACVAVYLETLDEDGQVEFKGKAKAFTRTYGFLSSILTWNVAEWHYLATFLGFLIPKLPAPVEEDLSKGVLEAIDMDSYRVEVHAALEITLPDDADPLGPVPTSEGGFIPEPEMDRLSNILNEFNALWGGIDWKDDDKIRDVITREIPEKVAADTAYQNAMQHSGKQNARIEHDKALQRVITALLSDHTELFKQYSDDPNFRKWLADLNFNATYTAPD